WFAGKRPGYRGVCHGGEISKGSRGNLARVVTGNSKAKINRRGHGDGGSAKLRPALAVETGKPGEHAAHALQAQPGVRIIDRKRTGQDCRSIGGSARLKIASAD